MTHETRSVEPAGGTLDLFPDLPRPRAPGPEGAPRPRVGGRQARPSPRRGGGGYLDGCTASELRNDARLRELAEIGLSRVWLDTAQLLGYDLFIELWRHLAADESLLTHDHHQIVLLLRDFSYYERVQRDLYIRRLASLGIPSSEIHAMVKTHLNDHSSYSAIKKVTASKWLSSRFADYGAQRLSPYLQERIRSAAHSPERPDMFPVDLEHAIMAEACIAKPAASQRAGQYAGDARLAELIDIGLKACWLAVAKLVGYDAFVALWRRWSGDPSLRDRNGMIRLRLRTFRTYERYQRNRYIETLVAAGLKPSDISAALDKDLGEKLSDRHLKRLAAAGRVHE